MGLVVIVHFLVLQFECGQQFLEILIGVGSTLGGEPIIIIGISKGIAKEGNFDKIIRFAI